MEDKEIIIKDTVEDKVEVSEKLDTLKKELEKMKVKFKLILF